MQPVVIHFHVVGRADQQCMDNKDDEERSRYLATLHNRD